MFWEFTSNQIAPIESTAEPHRDDVGDHSRGDQEGEAREEEKHETHLKPQDEHPSDVSMFSTLTELLLNPFLDGYCKTPFCSDADYLPPSCPSTSGYYYTAPPNYSRKHQAGGDKSAVVVDEYGDISPNNSGLSSGAGSHARRRRHHQRPLALAVGYGNEWKDMEGRRVVITPSSSRLSQYQQTHGHGGSPSSSPNPYGSYSSPGRGRQAAAQCTCTASPSTNSLISPENDNRDLSPHQTKSVMCKACTTSRLYDLEVPPSHSSGTTSSHHLPPRHGTAAVS